MSNQFIITSIIGVFYISMGLGTYIKHYESFKSKYILFCLFLLPAKSLVKTFSLLTMVCSAVYGAHVANKNNLDMTIDGKYKRVLEIDLVYFK